MSSSSSLSTDGSEERVDIEIVATAASFWLSQLTIVGPFLLPLPEELFLKHDFYLCGLRKRLGKSCAAIIRWCISESSAAPHAGLRGEARDLLRAVHRRFTETREGEELILHRCAQGLYGSCCHCGCPWRLPLGSVSGPLRAICVQCWRADVAVPVVPVQPPSCPPSSGHTHGIHEDSRVQDDSGQWYSSSVPASLLLELCKDNMSEPASEAPRGTGTDAGTAQGDPLADLLLAIRSSVHRPWCTSHSSWGPDPRPSPQPTMRTSMRGMLTGPQPEGLEQLETRVQELRLHGFRLHSSAVPAALRLSSRPAGTTRTSPSSPAGDAQAGIGIGAVGVGEGSSSEDTEDGSIKGVRRPVTLPPIARRRKHPG